MAKKPVKKAKKKVVKKQGNKTLTAIQKKRVAIAKDALAQLKLGSYDPQSCNCFISFSCDTQDELDAVKDSCEIFTGKTAEDIEFNKFMDNLINPKKPCTVCAKGALFLSSIRKFNNFTLAEADEAKMDYQASDEIREIFGDDNADLIELYFEGNDPYPWEGDKWSEDKSDNERLELILQNVIKNKGTFKPEQLKGYVAEDDWEKGGASFFGT